MVLYSSIALVFTWMSLILVGSDATWVEKCSLKYFEQPKDHFSFRKGQPTYKQRVLYNLQHFRKNGPIFFYLGKSPQIVE